MFALKFVLGGKSVRLGFPYSFLDLLCIIGIPRLSNGLVLLASSFGGSQFGKGLKGGRE